MMLHEKVRREKLAPRTMNNAVRLDNVGRPVEAIGSR
jgi:hypothetical protein